MASYEEDFESDDLDNYTGDDLVKRLRKQLSSAQKQLREQEQYMQELVSVTHEQTVSGMLEEFGLNPKIARFIPDDVQSEDDLADWLDEYGDAFGIESVGEEATEDDPSIQAANLMSEVEEGGIDPEVGYDLSSRMEGANSAEELMRILGQA